MVYLFATNITPWLDLSKAGVAIWLYEKKKNTYYDSQHLLLTNNPKVVSIIQLYTQPAHRTNNVLVVFISRVGYWLAEPLLRCPILITGSIY